MDEQLIALYHRHVASAFDRQLRFADFLERKAAGDDWAYDVETATLSFGKLKFEAPLVGSHAFNNDSWLWAWSNRHIRLTLTNRALGDVVRATAHRVGVHALAGPGFAIEPLLGIELLDHTAHVLGTILSSELGYDAYYTTPYEGGLGLVLVRDERLKHTEKNPLRRVLTVFPKVIAAVTVLDHKAAFTGYAHDYGVHVAEEQRTVRVATGNDSLTATFDDAGRLAKLEGTVQPEAQKPAKKVVKKPAKKPAKKPVRAVAKKLAKPAAKATKIAAKKTTAKVVKKPAKTAKPVKTAKPAKKPAKKR